MDLQRFIHELPKAELHVHLEGTLEPGMVHMLAARNDINLPPTFQEAVAQGQDYAFNDLTSFLAVYYPAMSVLRESQDFYDLAYAFFLKCREQNVVHVEMFFDPQAHTSRGVPFPTIMGGIRRAILQARAELRISVGLIMCFLRDMSAEFAMATLMDALPYKDWIVGVGLDSDERGNPPIKFQAVFERARKEGFMITAHCDPDQPDSIKHIQQCVEVIGVNRIDHGTNIVEDDRLIEIVRSKGLGLTTCPMSNMMLYADSKTIEIRQLMNRGVRVTINSDDPAYFHGYAEENVTFMSKDAKFEAKELVALQRNAFSIAWISQASRDYYLEQLDSFANMAGLNSRRQSLA